MKLVLDSSVALKVALPEKDSDKAIALCGAFEQGAHELLAPDVFPIEAGHALTKAERRGLIAIGQASILIADLPIPEFHPSIPLLQRAIDISSIFRVAVHDCLYVALAEQEHCDLLTADQRLLNSLRKDFSFLIDLADLP